MPSDKAPGIDKISIRVIKHSLPAILPSVTSIINESLASNTFPTEWKTAEVIPVLKDGDHEKPNNTGLYPYYLFFQNYDSVSL